MSKELPYYQFEVAEYLAGDIMICSLEAQGLFSIIKCIYWQKECELNVKQILKRYNKQSLIDELIEEQCMKVDKNGKIHISFLIKQYAIFIERKRKLSEAGRKGGLHKKEASLKPPLSLVKATPKHIEEKREEENILKEKYIKRNAYNFLKENAAEELEVFEMQNRKNIPDYKEFIKFFNNKVEIKELKYKPGILMATLDNLKNSWNQNTLKQSQNEYNPSDHIPSG